MMSTNSGKRKPIPKKQKTSEVEVEKKKIEVPIAHDLQPKCKYVPPVLMPPAYLLKKQKTDAYDFGVITPQEKQRVEVPNIHDFPHTIAFGPISAYYNPSSPSYNPISYSYEPPFVFSGAMPDCIFKQQ